MARKTFTRPSEQYDREYQNYLVSELENQSGLTFNKGERIEANGGDQTEIVLVSLDGSKFKIQVDNSGNLSTTAVS